MNLSAKEKVLLSFLGVIFSTQLVFLGWSLSYCMARGGLASCPDIGKRAELTFGGQVATVLALITNIGTGRNTK
jgi:hypothetical protein|tara:strand:- start:237 stop:458 length:222 start_codon:yes stop_codon:yes gene_type:complete